MPARAGLDGRRALLNLPARRRLRHGGGGQLRRRGLDLRLGLRRRLGGQRHDVRLGRGHGYRLGRLGSGVTCSTGRADDRRHAARPRPRRAAEADRHQGRLGLGAQQPGARQHQQQRQYHDVHAKRPRDHLPQPLGVLRANRDDVVDHGSHGRRSTEAGGCGLDRDLGDAAFNQLVEDTDQLLQRHRAVAGQHDVGRRTRRRAPVARARPARRAAPLPCPICTLPSRRKLAGTVTVIGSLTADDRPRLRQVDVEALLHHRRRDHEDDEQHEHDVDERHDVDLGERLDTRAARARRAPSRPGEFGSGSSFGTSAPHVKLRSAIVRNSIEKSSMSFAERFHAARQIVVEVHGRNGREQTRPRSPRAPRRCPAQRRPGSSNRRRRSPGTTS